jgi:PPM family protein phosphatase
LHIDFAEVSLRGAREDNQDKATALVAEQVALLLVIDGMGGHAEGARAAQLAQKVLVEAFQNAALPLLDPLGFLHLNLGRAHEEVVGLGLHLPLEQRPRATCAMCVVQKNTAWWAHIGDTRIYHVRRGALLQRTRDHSHVELLLREGLITPDQVRAHPMRNFVECCLGGDPVLPDMSISTCLKLEVGDTLLVCSDGLWGSVSDEEIVVALGGTQPLRDNLLSLGKQAVQRAGAASDNTSAAALRVLE